MTLPVLQGPALADPLAQRSSRLSCAWSNSHTEGAVHLRLFAGLRKLSLRQNLLTDAGAISQLASAPCKPSSHAVLHAYACWYASTCMSMFCQCTNMSRSQGTMG